jgi:hypothetical protein
MNKLYILGALALANVEAYVAFVATAGTALTITIALASSGLGGSYTYAFTADCIASTTLTTLGMNNIYHQYYYYAMSKGTATYSAGTAAVTTITIGTIATQTLTTITNVYSGCWHSHIYNWMAQPTLAATAIVTSVTSGFGNSVVGYGYAMVGTATTSCVASTIVTTTLFLKSVFYGAQYQSSILTVTPTVTALIVPVWGKSGPG